MNTARPITVLSLAAIMAATVAAPAFAQKMRTEGPQDLDPVMAWADRAPARNQFVLDSDQDVELIRFSTPRDIEICIPRSRQASVDSSKAVSVKVSWDNNTGVIAPGNCMSFDARSVKVRASGPIGDDAQLVGSFRVLHH